MGKLLKRAVIMATVVGALTLGAMGIFKRNPQIPEVERDRIVYALSMTKDRMNDGTVDIYQLREMASFLDQLKKEYRVDIPQNYNGIVAAAQKLQEFDVCVEDIERYAN